MREKKIKLNKLMMSDAYTLEQHLKFLHKAELADLFEETVKEYLCCAVIVKTLQM